MSAQVAGTTPCGGRPSRTGPRATGLVHDGRAPEPERAFLLRRQGQGQRHLPSCEAIEIDAHALPPVRRRHRPLRDHHLLVRAVLDADLEGNGPRLERPDRQLHARTRGKRDVEPQRIGRAGHERLSVDLPQPGEPMPARMPDRCSFREMIRTDSISNVAPAASVGRTRRWRDAMGIEPVGRSVYVRIPPPATRRAVERPGDDEKRSPIRTSGLCPRRPGSGPTGSLPRMRASAPGPREARPGRPIAPFASGRSATSRWIGPPGSAFVTFRSVTPGPAAQGAAGGDGFAPGGPGRTAAAVFVTALAAANRHSLPGAAGAGAALVFAAAGSGL